MFNGIHEEDQFHFFRGAHVEIIQVLPRQQSHHTPCTLYIHVATLYIFSKPLIMRLLVNIYNFKAVVCGGNVVVVLVCLCMSSFFFFLMCTAVLYTSDYSCIYMYMYMYVC